MTLVYLVNQERFIKEYKLHISLLKDKVVNWYVDSETGYLKLFINSTNGTEIYCYEHKGTYQDLAETLKECISSEGEILGIMKDKKETTKVEWRGA